MKESITIKDFGPIKNIKLDLKEVTVFIGTQGSGKSCISKLVSIFRSSGNLTNNYDFIGELNKYNILNFLKDSTFIEYKSKHYSILVKNKIYECKKSGTEEVNMYDSEEEKLHSRVTELLKGLNLTEKDKHSSSDLQEKIFKFNQELADVSILKNTITSLKNTIVKEPLYIPSERIFISSISESLFGLAKSRISLPACITEFGSLFETYRKDINNYHINFLDVDFNNTKKNSKIILKDKTEINLSEASSGLQALIPMLIVIEGTRLKEINTTYVIEEPEINLYPLNQKYLLYFLIDKCHNSNKSSDLLITTHSPFILHTLNICLQAYVTAHKTKNNNEKVKKIISEEKWINPKKFNAYYLHDGTASQIYNIRTHNIGINNLDDVANQIDEDIASLYEIEREG